MKICHLADCHIGVGYPGPSPFSRFQDIEKVMSWTADRIIEEKVQLVLIAGDCFKDAKVMLDRASQEIASIVRFLRRLSGAGIEVIVISGTPSHDAVAAYELIGEMNIPDVFVYTQPFPGVPTDGSVSISVLPGLNRSALLTNDEMKGLPPEQIHREMTERITRICMGMAAQMPNDKPKILMAHMTYQGAETGFTDLLMQHEPILTREAIAGFDLVCLGHIHRPQQIDGKVFYSGPIERLSFNEEDITPGFWIHETAPRNSYDIFTSRFIEAPARRYYSIEIDEEMVKSAISWLSDDPPWLFGEEIKDAIVRLRYSCSEEVAKQLNRKQLEQSLYDAGCFYVAEIKGEVQRQDRARDNTVTEALGPLEALVRWCDTQGIDPEEAKAMQSMTQELMESGV